MFASLLDADFSDFLITAGSITAGVSAASAFLIAEDFDTAAAFSDVEDLLFSVVFVVESVCSTTALLDGDLLTNMLSIV